MRRLDDPRSPFDHAGCLAEVLLGLDVTLETWSDAGCQFFRGRVFNLWNRTLEISTPGNLTGEAVVWVYVRGSLREGLKY